MLRRTRQDLSYQRERERGVKQIALTWEQIVWEACQAIGECDANAWLAGMSDILADEFFVRDPVPCAFAAETRARNKFPHVLGHTWVSPHPEAWHKLGYYQIWRPNGQMEEVFGESDVRVALLENKISKAKL
jgi:hypothetical protein